MKDVVNILRSNFQKITCTFRQSRQILHDQLRFVIDGTRKNEIMDLSLEIILTEVDSFLSARGFLIDAVPPDYTDRPPEDMETINVNLEIVRDIMTQIEKGEEDAEKFMNELTDRVYGHLNLLLDEMQYVLSDQWVSHVDGITMSDRERSKLKLDVDHIMAMQARDKEIMDDRKSGTRVYRPLEMSAVVPVAGLILARFHMNLCELTTVVELWGSTRGGRNKSTSPRMHPAVALIVAAAALVFVAAVVVVIVDAAVVLDFVAYFFLSGGNGMFFFFL